MLFHHFIYATGVWLPPLAFQGPICLREDLFVALYMHHLDATSTFSQLPFYFKRQLAARFERTVIFPGWYIQELVEFAVKVWGIFGVRISNIWDSKYRRFALCVETNFPYRNHYCERLSLNKVIANVLEFWINMKDNLFYLVMDIECKQIL